MRVLIREVGVEVEKGGVYLVQQIRRRFGNHGRFLETAVEMVLKKGMLQLLGMPGVVAARNAGFALP